MIKMKESQIDGKCEINDYIGQCFLDIANGLSNRPNFINYTFKEDMVFDGVENCIRYCHNFDPDKSKNPFSYFTQIVYYAFLRRIEKEKKQSYIKFKMTEMTRVEELVDSEGNINIEKSYNVYQHDFSNFVESKYFHLLSSLRKLYLIYFYYIYTLH